MNPGNGPLRNGNHRGNPQLAPRCGARTRRGTACRGPAMKNGRCRTHAGSSTGAKTQDGHNSIAQARTRHGHYGEYGRMLRAIVRDLAARARGL